MLKKCVCVCVYMCVGGWGVVGGLRLFLLLPTRTKAASRNALAEVPFCPCQQFGRKGGSKTAMLSGTSPKSASQMQSFGLIIFFAQSESVDTALFPWVKIQKSRKQFPFKVNKQIPPDLSILHILFMMFIFLH